MSKITFRCDVCGRDTTLNNVQPGRKIFCLHCGHKITDCYQQGMDFNMSAESSSVPNNSLIPPLPPIDNLDIQMADEPQPSWKTEPYIRINWKRIGYTIKTIFKGIGTFFSKRWASIREGFRTDTASSNGSPVQYGDPLNAPIPDAAPSQTAQEPELPFGYVDRRQLRMQQSFSKNFADSGAIPASSANPNYSQQRIEQSFTNSFTDTGAIPASSANPNYSQQRIEQSFTNSFNDSGSVPVPPSDPNYNQQRIEQSFTNSFNDTGAVSTPPSDPNYNQQRIEQSFTNSFNESGAVPVPPSDPNYNQQRIEQSFTKSFQEENKKLA